MQYRKKPIVIDAVQFNGTNQEEIIAWTNGAAMRDPYYKGDDLMIIPTLEGEMRADLNDWIIKGVVGEFYPCKPEIFEATYERA